MKNPSLFIKAAKKYTSMAHELREAKKSFLSEEVAPAKPVTAADLNKLYQSKEVKSSPVKSSMPIDTSSNPNGAPNVPGASSPETDAEALETAITFDDQKPTQLPNGDLLYYNKETDTWAISSKKPQNGKILSTDAVKQMQDLAKTAKTVLTQATNEDIMSALTTLSTGDVVANEEDELGEGEVEVQPAGDMLVDEGEEGTENEEEETDESSVETSDVVTAASTQTMPTTKLNNASSNGSEVGTEIEGAEEEEDSEDTEPEDSQKAGIKPGSGESEEAEANPSGKETAFWVPGDDLLGLKDVVGSNAKANGVPDAQERIVKDSATGALVKKPTTPAHPIPNMRQYVKTSGVNGAPPMGMQQQADISDLDSVMGLDTASDRALNISLNFNF